MEFLSPIGTSAIDSVKKTDLSTSATAALFNHFHFTIQVVQQQQGHGSEGKERRRFSPLSWLPSFSLFLPVCCRGVCRRGEAHWTRIIKNIQQLYWAPLFSKRGPIEAYNVNLIFLKKNQRGGPFCVEIFFISDFTQVSCANYSAKLEKKKF